MGDIRCRKCGEPWDAYGVDHGDMTKSQAYSFKLGLGCPACGMGTTCPSCEGTGIEENDCPNCHGRGKILVRRLAGHALWHHFGPRNFPEVRNARIIKRLPSFQALDGWCEEAFAICPVCKCKGEPCLECKGDGKLHRCDNPEDRDALELQGLASLIENSEEDCIKFLPHS